MDKASISSVPCASHVDIHVTHIPHTDAADKELPTYVFGTPTYTDPLFRQMDFRSMVNGSTTCSLQELRASSAQQSRKEYLAASMVFTKKARLAHHEEFANETGGHLVFGEFEYTFRRGKQSYHSELNEHACSWEDLEKSGVIFDAK